MMSLGGLVAYGDSDDSDLNDEESDIEDKKSVTIIETGAGHNEKSKNETDSKSSEKKGFLNIGTVDDIEDDEFEHEVHSTSASAPGVIHQDLGLRTAGGFGLKLPPPKHHANASKGSQGFLGDLSSKKVDHAKDDPKTNKSVLDEDVSTGPPSQSILAGLPAPKDVTPKINEVNMEEDEIEDEIKEKASRLAELAKPPPKPAKRQPVKITVPSLEDYESDEEEKPSKKKPRKSTLQGKSGLFALLPEPKNFSVKTTNRPLIPYTLTKKAPQPAKPSKTLPPPAKRKPQVASVLPGIPSVGSDDEDDGDGPVSFFSFGESSRPQINTAPVVEETEKVEPILLGPWQQKSAGVVNDSSLIPVSSKGQTVVSDSLPGQSTIVSGLATGDGVSDAPLRFTGPEQGPSYPSQTTREYAEISYAGPSDLDKPEYQYNEDQNVDVEQYLQDEEFLKLAGKRQRGKEKIDIIDVHAQEQTSVDQLTKNLTEEVSGFSHSRKRDDLPSSQSRRKHQITYLAYQAKERELELKNQWAHNKVTKRQTQSKYGF